MFSRRGIWQGIVRRPRGLLAALAMTVATQANAEPLELNVAVASSSMAYPALWLALADNMFEQNGLRLNVTQNALSTGAAMLVSGRADIFVTNSLAGLRIAEEGKPVSYIWSFSNIDATAWAFVSRPGISSMEQLAAAGGKCSIVTLPPGSAHYAYLQGVIKEYKLGCRIGIVATMPLLTASVSSGQYDAAPVVPMDGYTLVESGRANMLLDPEKIGSDEIRAIYPYSHSLTAAFGLRSNLTTHRPAVIVFVKTLAQANRRLHTIDDEAFVQKLRTLTEAFGTTTPSSLLVQWRLEKHLVPAGPAAGTLDEAGWNDMLRAASTVWNLAGVRPGDLPIQYREMVDMSYLSVASDQ